MANEEYLTKNVENGVIYENIVDIHTNLFKSAKLLCALNVMYKNAYNRLAQHYSLQQDNTNLNTTILSVNDINASDTYLNYLKDIVNNSLELYNSTYSNILPLFKKYVQVVENSTFLLDYYTINDIPLITLTDTTPATKTWNVGEVVLAEDINNYKRRIYELTELITELASAYYDLCQRLNLTFTTPSELVVSTQTNAFSNLVSQPTSSSPPTPQGYTIVHYIRIRPTIDAIFYRTQDNLIVYKEWDYNKKQFIYTSQHILDVGIPDISVSDFTGATQIEEIYFQTTGIYFNPNHTKMYFTRLMLAKVKYGSSSEERFCLKTKIVDINTSQIIETKVNNYSMAGFYTGYTPAVYGQKRIGNCFYILWGYKTSKNDYFLSTIYRFNNDIEISTIQHISGDLYNHSYICNGGLTIQNQFFDAFICYKTDVKTILECVVFILDRYNIYYSGKLNGYLGTLGSFTTGVSSLQVYAENMYNSWGKCVIRTPSIHFSLTDYDVYNRAEFNTSHSKKYNKIFNSWGFYASSGAPITYSFYDALSSYSKTSSSQIIQTNRTGGFYINSKQMDNSFHKNFNIYFENYKDILSGYIYDFNINYSSTGKSCYYVSRAPFIYDGDYAEPFIDTPDKHNYGTSIQYVKLKYWGQPSYKNTSYKFYIYAI